MVVVVPFLLLLIFSLGVSSAQEDAQKFGYLSLTSDDNPNLLVESPRSIIAACNGWLDTSHCAIKQDLSRGLILHYTFDNASNLAQDSTENGYDGNVVGLLTQTAGVIGSGVYFNGTFSDKKEHHYIELPNVVNTRAYTVSLWANLSVPASHNSLFMLHGGQGFQNSNGELRYNWPASNLWIFTSHGKLAVIQAQVDLRYVDFPLPVGSTVPDLVPRMSKSPLLVTSSWHHIAVTFSEGRLSAYVDGYLVYEFINVNSVPVTPKSQRVYVGDCLCQHTSHPDSYEIKGTLDDLRVYSRALSSVEVKQLVMQAQMS